MLERGDRLYSFLTRVKEKSMSPDDHWVDYLRALKRLELSVRLVSFWTQETAEATLETARETEEVVRNVREYLNK